MTISYFTFLYGVEVSFDELISEPWLSMFDVEVQKMIHKYIINAEISDRRYQDLEIILSVNSTVKAIFIYDNVLTLTPTYYVGFEFGTHVFDKQVRELIKTETLNRNQSKFRDLTDIKILKLIDILNQPERLLNVDIKDYNLAVSRFKLFAEKFEKDHKNLIDFSVAKHQMLADAWE